MSKPFEISREEMTKALILDILDSGFVDDIIDDVLRKGWKGYDNYTDEELISSYKTLFDKDDLAADYPEGIKVKHETKQKG